MAGMNDGDKAHIAKLLAAKEARNNLAKSNRENQKYIRERDLKDYPNPAHLKKGFHDNTPSPQSIADQEFMDERARRM